MAGRRRHGRALLDAAVKGTTIERYRLHVFKFAQWGLSVEEDPTDPVEMDEVLCDYIHYLHQYGQPKSHASLAFCGLIYFMPKYRSHLHLSFRALRGWNKLRPPTVRPPATRGVALGTAAELWHRGHREASVMVLLAFEGFLRNAEVVALRFNDIALPGDMRLGVAPEGTAGVRIRRAKTGGEQWATIQDPLVVEVLRHFMSTSATGESRLFPSMTSDRFRTAFYRAQKWLGFANAIYTPHSLRHGHASEAFLAGASLETIMARGRWASVNTARYYIQTGRALLLTVSLPAEVQLRMRLYQKWPRHCFRLPPATSWDADRLGGYVSVSRAC